MSENQGRSGKRRPSRTRAGNPARSNTRPRQANRPNPAEAGLDPARVAARDVLRAVRERDAYANLVLPALLRERRLGERDAALATELAYGASRARGLLDSVIAHAASRPVEEIDGPLLDVLRLGAYQLLRTRIAPHAAVATSVDMVRAEAGPGKSGFVNAVLRRVSERTEADWVAELAPPADRDPVGNAAFRHAHPTWIAQAFHDALGADAGELDELLAADDARPAVHLVARPGEISADELALVTGGEVGPWSPYAVHLDGGDPGRLDAVREGLAGVQDEGSQLVARALVEAPLEGDDGGRWLDLCAGPGGKAALLGTGGRGRCDRRRGGAVRASRRSGAVVDARPAGHGAHRRRSVQRSRAGLRPHPRRRAVYRARSTASPPRGALASSAGGRRGPGRSATRAARRSRRARPPGGVVVYATCSPHLSETIGVVGDAVRRHGLIGLDTGVTVPGVPRSTRPTPGRDGSAGTHVQLWPHRHGTDAMFFAALRRPGGAQ